MIRTTNPLVDWVNTVFGDPSLARVRVEAIVIHRSYEMSTRHGQRSESAERAVLSDTVRNPAFSAVATIADPPIRLKRNFTFLSKQNRPPKGFSCDFHRQGTLPL